MSKKTKKGGLARTHNKSFEVIDSASENLYLIDAWRVLNPDSSRFTWRQKKPEIHCRLDFFLINQCTFCNIINVEILAGYKTDHSMITLQISLHSNTRGRGLLLPPTAKILNKTKKPALVVAKCPVLPVLMTVRWTIHEIHIYSIQPKQKQKQKQTEKRIWYVYIFSIIIQECYKNIQPSLARKNNIFIYKK